MGALQLVGSQYPLRNYRYMHGVPSRRAVRIRLRLLQARAEGCVALCCGKFSQQPSNSHGLQHFTLQPSALWLSLCHVGFGFQQPDKLSCPAGA